MHHRGQFGVVIGIDGSGKSTILQSLQRRGIRSVDWRDLRTFEEVDYLAPPRPREVRAKLKPMSRAMFVAAHLAAEYEYLVEPVLAKGQSVLLDSYYFKWFAKESIYGKTHPIFFSICNALPKPDLLIVLRIAPETAFYRKAPGLSPFEYFEQPTLPDFKAFQAKVLDLIIENAKTIPMIGIDADQETKAIEEELFNKLIELGWETAYD